MKEKNIESEAKQWKMTGAGSAGTILAAKIAALTAGASGVNSLEIDEEETLNPLSRRINWLHKDRLKLIVLLELLEAADLISLDIGKRKQCFGAFIHFNFLQDGRMIGKEQIRADRQTFEYQEDRDKIAIELQRDLTGAAHKLFATDK